MILKPIKGTYNENENVSIATFSDAKKTFKNIRISNINKLIFGYLNINSLRNEFDLLCEDWHLAFGIQLAFL